MIASSRLLARMRRSGAPRAASLSGYALIVGLIAVTTITATSESGGEVLRLFGGTAEELAAVTGDQGTGDLYGEGAGEPAPVLPYTVSLAEHDFGTVANFSPIAFDFTTLATLSGGPADSTATVADL